MKQLHQDQQLSHVTALFTDRSLSISAPRAATFEDLADRLTLLGGREPLTVTVRMDRQNLQKPFPDITVLRCKRRPSRGPVVTKCG